MFRYYFDEKNHKAMGYYCSYNGNLFKTENEYRTYIEEHGLTTIKTLLWRMSKYSSINHFDKDGSWIEYEIVPGTEIFDNRDLTAYNIKDQQTFDRLMKCFAKYNDYYIERCTFGGYDNSADYTYADSNEPIPPFDPTKENQTYAFYVISYMPTNKKLRKLRMNAHLLQLNNMKRLAPNTRIYVMAQNWKDEEYLDDPQITYCKFGKLGAGKARNVALKMLYESNYDYGCITDDDITLKETNSAKEFFRELRENPAKFIEMDVIQNRCLAYDMFNYMDLTMSEFTSKNWHFQQTWEGQVHMTFIKNFKKYYDEEEYQDEIINPKDNTGFDDTDFYLMLCGKGYKNYVATFLQRYLGCMTEKESVVEGLDNPCFVYDNLCAARRRHLDRLPDGRWDFWKLQGPMKDINIERENEGDTYSEMTGNLINILKKRYEKEKQPKESAIDSIIEKDKSGAPIDNDYDII